MLDLPLVGVTIKHQPVLISSTSRSRLRFQARHPTLASQSFKRHLQTLGHDFQSHYNNTSYHNALCYLAHRKSLQHSLQSNLPLEYTGSWYIECNCHDYIDLTGAVRYTCSQFFNLQRTVQLACKGVTRPLPD